MMRATNKCRAGWLASLLLFAPGCGNALVFSTSTLYGIELNALEGGQQSVKFAMQRFEGVSMPACKYESAGDWFGRQCASGTMRPKAYATLALMDTKTGALLLPDLSSGHIKQVFATGEAAAATGAPDAAATTFGALEGKAAYVTTDQRRVRIAMDVVGTQDNAQDLYDRAASSLPQSFRDLYNARKKARPSDPNRNAFLGAKNDYTFGEGAMGPKARQVAEALESATK